jgi:hypothetical protein
MVVRVATASSRRSAIVLMAGSSPAAKASGLSRTDLAIEFPKRAVVDLSLEPF